MFLSFTSKHRHLSRRPGGHLYYHWGGRISGTSIGVGKHLRSPSGPVGVWGCHPDGGRLWTLSGWFLCVRTLVTGGRLDTWHGQIYGPYRLTQLTVSRKGRLWSIIVDLLHWRRSSRVCNCFPMSLGLFSPLVLW